MINILIKIQTFLKQNHIAINGTLMLLAILASHITAINRFNDGDLVWLVYGGMMLSAVSIVLLTVEGLILLIEIIIDEC